MNTRERFLEVMRFNRKVAPVKWEFGYWGGTINNWYAQGLPRKRYPEIPTEVTVVSATRSGTVVKSAPRISTL